MYLPGIRVRQVEFAPPCVVVTVALCRRRLRCPLISFETSSGYDTRPVERGWRHLDLGTWKLELRFGLRGLTYPVHGVRTEAVEFARPGARETRDLDDLIGYLATAMEKTASCRLLRVDWDTVGRCMTRVMGERLDVNRLDALFEIGVLSRARMPRP